MPRGVRPRTNGARRAVCRWAALSLAAWPLLGCVDSTREPLESAELDAAEQEPALDAGVQFVEGYQAGCEAAHQSGKPMLVFFTARWCTYCHQLAAETLSEAEVVRLSRQFVCVKIDADQERDVCRTFRVNGYPTIQFLSPHGVPLNRVVGKRSSNLLLHEMQAALLAVAQRVEPIRQRTTY